MGIIRQSLVRCMCRWQQLLVRYITGLHVHSIMLGRSVDGFHELAVLSRQGIQRQSL